MVLQKFIFSLFASIMMLTSHFSWAQDADSKNKNPFPVKYVNLSDENLIIKSVALAPVFDNVEGVYKTKIDEHLQELVSKDTFWAKAVFKTTQKDFRLDDLENKADVTLKVLQDSQTDGIITCFILKGPQGLNVQLNLFTKDGGKLLVRENFQDQNVFEISKVKNIVSQLYEQMKSRLPYSGYITSRKGNSVTVNMGAQAGLKNGDVLTVAQIIKINRHPKSNFMIGVEKEIIGRVILNQVEDHTSFGEISFEKETGVIAKGSKILPLNFVKYTSTQSAPVAEAFPSEKNPYEWLPTPTPQFGKIQILGGFSHFSDSTVLQDGTSLDTGNSFAPAVSLGVELWVTPEVFANIDLRQMLFKGSNQLPGSSPKEFNYSVSRAEFSMGYKYLVEGSFWGPQVYASAGYLSHTVRVSDSSPTAFTSFELTGINFTAGGLFPVTLKKDWALGAQAKFMVMEHFSESPVDSGSANADFNEFDIISNYQYSANINLKGVISLTNIQASFNQSGTKNPISRSLDEKITAYLVGVEYLF